MPEIALQYQCGCSETWQVSMLAPGEPQVLRSEYTCPPEVCPDCARHGRACPTRAGSYAYPLEPITWSEDAPRRRYTRRKS